MSYLVKFDGTGHLLRLRSALSAGTFKAINAPECRLRKDLHRSKLTLVAVLDPDGAVGAETPRGGAVAARRLRCVVRDRSLVVDDALEDLVRVDLHRIRAARHGILIGDLE